MEGENIVIENNNFTNVNVKYLRESKGISQTKLAQDLKIDTSTVGKWENNTRQITLEWAIKLANYFNINVGEFISVNQITKKKIDLNDNDYKRILKEKGLMDENEIINEESLDKLIKIADMVENLTTKKED